MDAEIERRVQEEITKRMELEMEKQKESIEVEIQRRVGEARKQIERELTEEHAKQKQHDYKLQLEREVCKLVKYSDKNNNNNNKKITTLSLFDLMTLQPQKFTFFVYDF